MTTKARTPARTRIRSSNSTKLSDQEADGLIDQWESLSKSMDVFEEKHRNYLSALNEIEKLKKDHRAEFKRIESQVRTVNQAINKYQSSLEPAEAVNRGKERKSDDALRIRRESERKAETFEDRVDRLVSIREHLTERLTYLQRIKYTLPHPPERYLRLILGSELPVSILDKADQWKYKEGYEKFKLRFTLIRFFLSLCLATFLHVSRLYDIVFSFLLVWFYCTLTIRESILMMNGSKIDSWWRIHHFLSTVANAVLVLWSSTDSYQYFRQQNYYFNIYVSMVQVLLYYYQRGLLYRLRALGDSDVLQITIEGFHSWMLRGLSFLAPFLFLAYLFEFYNGYVLFHLSNMPSVETNTDWQLIMKILSIFFFIFSIGNILTMYLVIRRKIRQRISDIQWLRHRYESAKTLIDRFRSVKSFRK